MPGQSQCSPMPPLQEVRRGGAFWASWVCEKSAKWLRSWRRLPSQNSQPRARNSVPGRPHWRSGRLMGFLFCRGSKFRPRVQVFREALNHERLPRTATHTLAARVAHTRGRACRLRCAGWIDSRRGVGSAQKSEIFSCGLDRRAVIRPSTTALSLSQCLHVAPRLTRC